jgi:hypothetical protein
MDDGQVSDFDSEYYIAAIESDDIYVKEHISEDSDSNQDDTVPGDQPETIRKDGIACSMQLNPIKDRILAANIMKKS